jgi:hypothetical protein
LVLLEPPESSSLDLLGSQGNGGTKDASSDGPSSSRAFGDDNDWLVSFSLVGLALAWLSLPLWILLLHVHAATKAFATPRATMVATSLGEEDDPICHVHIIVLLSEAHDDGSWLMGYIPSTGTPNSAG